MVFPKKTYSYSLVVGLLVMACILLAGCTSSTQTPAVNTSTPSSVSSVPPDNAADTHTITVTNNLKQTVWINLLLGGESTFSDGTKCSAAGCKEIPANSGNFECCPVSQCSQSGCGPKLVKCTKGPAIPYDGGFRLDPGQSKAVEAQSGWQLTMWARTGCTGSDNDLTCETGTCKSAFDGKGKLACGGIGSDYPATKGEIKFDGGGGCDFYDVSLNDGFNVPMTIAPVKDTTRPGTCSSGKYQCGIAGGSVNLNSILPASLSEFAFKTVKGDTVGILSACKYTVQKDGKENLAVCCPAAEGYTSDKCHPETWPANLQNIKNFFKTNLPNAYSWTYDDPTSTFQCTSMSKDVASDYTVTIG